MIDLKKSVSVMYADFSKCIGESVVDVGVVVDVVVVVDRR